MAVKNHYYVLVLTDDGPVFVTSTLPHHYAEYDKLKAPKEFTRESANDIASGLRLNLFTAYAVCLPYSMSAQPYRYDKGYFEWKWNSESKDVKEEK